MVVVLVLVSDLRNINNNSRFSIKQYLNEELKRHLLFGDDSSRRTNVF